MGNSDEAAIRKVIDAYGDRLRASDVRAVVDLYTDTAAVMQPELETTVGKQQLAAAYDSVFATMILDFTFELEEVLADGDIAAVRTTGTGTMTVRATGEAMPARFRELFVLRRLSNDWKIAQYMFQQLPAT
jgi:uncharacterized protein (TIGR02246 family)